MMTTTLPNESEMLTRLMAVDDNRYVKETFYTSLLLESGKEKSSEGIVVMLRNATAKFSKGMSIIIVASFIERLESYIGALVLDAKMAEEVKVYFRVEKWKWTC